MTSNISCPVDWKTDWSANLDSEEGRAVGTWMAYSRLGETSVCRISAKVLVVKDGKVLPRKLLRERDGDS